MKYIIRYIRLWLAVKFRTLRPKLLTEKEQLKISILELRASFRFFGFDTSEWSDEEFIERVEEGSKVLSRIGCTAKEMEEVANRKANGYETKRN